MAWRGEGDRSCWVYDGFDGFIWWVYDGLMFVVVVVFARMV
jgi:hypothetical protein